MPSIRLLNKLSISEYQAIVTGIPSYCPNATFLVNGQTLTATQAVTLVNTVLGTSTAVSTAKAELATARLAEQASIIQNGVTIKAIRATLALMFSTNVNALEAFAITPRKSPAPLSIAEKAAADAKRAATRAARGTKGKKQAAAITGNVVGVTITPVTTGTAATSTAPTGTATTTTTAASTAPLGAVATGTAAPIATGSSVTPATAPTNGSSTGATAQHA